MSSRFLATAVLAACVTVLSSGANAQAPVQRDYLSELTGIRPDVLPDGRIVISMDASGDLKGRLTMTLAEGEQGVTGTWVFVATYNEDLRADGTPIREDDHVAHDHDDPTTPESHREYSRVRRDGVIVGTATSVTLQRTADGQLVGVDRAEFVTTGGTLTFKTIKGSGRVGAWPALPGALTLLLSF
jgi:hypothetical protein